MDTEKQEFNYKEFEADAIKRLQNGEALEGKDGILAPLLKRLIEAGLNGELEGHLEESVIANRRNGKMSKQVKTAFGMWTSIHPETGTVPLILSFYLNVKPALVKRWIIRLYPFMERE